MKNTRWLVLSLLLIAALMLAACGGSDDGEEAAGGEAEATEAPAGGEETVDEPAATEAPAEEPAEAASGDRVEIRWFVGLGAGTDAEVIPAQEVIVDEFNASQDEIELVLEIVDADQAYTVLNTQIAAGNAPDIVGPTGIKGISSFPGAFLDINPLLGGSDVDMGEFEQELIDFWTIDDELVGLPFAVFPSFMMYNKDLFDEAGLPYPPDEYGAPYVDADGNELEWNMDTLHDLGMLLTVDVNGNDATSPDFDFDNIVQFGFSNVFTDLRGAATLFGPGNLIDDDGNAVFPDHWLTAHEYYQTAMWDEGWIPNGVYAGTDVVGWSPLMFGNVAMVHSHLWYVNCCLAEMESEFGVAATPSYNGVVTSKLHTDTFGIIRFTEHPEEAFEVLTYLIYDRALDTATIYGGMPARDSLLPEYLEAQADVMYGVTSGADLNWDLIRESIQFADFPSHEAALPSNNEASQRYIQLSQLYEQNPGVDLDAEIEQLLIDLQAIYDAAN